MCIVRWVPDYNLPLTVLMTEHILSVSTLVLLDTHCNDASSL